MHQNQKLVEERIARVLTERIVPAVYSATAPVSLRSWTVPDEPVPAAEALAAEYTPFALEQPWGRAWSTWWFEVTGEVPGEWAGRTVELVLDPGFQGDWPGNQAECLVFTPDGVPVKGIHPRNMYVRIAEDAMGGEPVHFFVEAAANPDILVNEFVPTAFGDKKTAPQTPIYRFRTAQLAVFEPEVWALRFDIEVLYQLVKELAETDPRRHEVLRALERSLDVLRLDDIVGTAAAARAELAEVLASPANPSAHVLSGIGHAHIDSAWLWPIRETKRKTGRTFSNVLELAKDYPELRFACSSAQQYAWVKERYPSVWEGIKAAIADGTWIPVGSQWVEPDGNLPGGEAMVRQITQGMRFFHDELDVETKGVWLPDSFGYTAAFPQIALLAGLEWFLTQKLSWNQTNTFPHHTFWWEGIDGSRIFTHFPPIDTYNATLEGEELHHAVRQFREKGRATTSLVPFGYGDGGGGPIREMMERQRRVESLEGSPKVVIEHPDEFFARAQAEYPDAPVWVGELYLELHRGTFTSHAREKRGNRVAEHRLREAELWWAAAAVQAGAEYPYAALDRLWQATLLQQFHDILPGSSIAWVHQENEAEYAANAAELDALITAAVALVAPAGAVLNTADHERTGLVESADGSARALVRVPGSGIAPLVAVEPVHPVEGSVTRLSNGLVGVVIDERGLLTSIRDLVAGRELVPEGRPANLLQLHEDLPNAWDAWDIDAHYRHSRTDLVETESIELVESGPLRATVRIVRSFGASRVEQFVSVVADDPRVHLRTEVDWAEVEKLLKVTFPLVVHAQHHSAEIQYGHVRRPTHTNTSWDDARFEVMAHRWVHVEEPGYGVGLTNAGSYGHDITRTVGVTGEVETEVRISLVRAARSPDPEQDLGHHRFDYALHPGASIEDVVVSGYEQNLPLRLAADGESTAQAWSLLALDGGTAHIESVKLADDRSGDVVVRLYEAAGSRSSTTLTTAFRFAAVTEVDLLERPLRDDMPRTRSFEQGDASVTLGLRPFQVVTLRFAR
ncbi:glycoside hydrolase family 38 C-terminal domain-containing protein [Rathayibacter sp. VKM Ac-2927]|uniref:alpha-mannosidase n=1 Tax=Rathayibacter sp. VKM Ac-2927 TaxID=2929478 RepID=UPI001FB55A65|nr:glycoside hydrolase family 38 C-terminal domain-containing protein [Rathayibacter sp. VKM Ac-2927]MCJ1687025.1 glycosyl hydrolase-related protein [Rathayibacter sp. VKM Ac-2927]